MVATAQHYQLDRAKLVTARLLQELQKPPQNIIDITVGNVQFIFNKW